MIFTKNNKNIIVPYWMKTHTESGAVMMVSVMFFIVIAVQQFFYSKLNFEFSGLLFARFFDSLID